MLIQLATATGLRETEASFSFVHFGYNFVMHVSPERDAEEFNYVFTISELSTGRKLISDYDKDVVVDRAKRFLDNKGELFFKTILARYEVLNGEVVV